MVLQNYQNLVEMISNMIYTVAFGGGFKCLCKIHLNTQLFSEIHIKIEVISSLEHSYTSAPIAQLVACLTFFN